VSAVDVSIVVVNYNTARLLDEMFAAINATADDLVLQTIVVDNGSRDGSAEFIRSHYPNVELIENSVNVGFGRANNQAIPLLRGRYVLLLNTDAFVASDTLTRTVAYLGDHPECAVVGVRLVGRDGEVQPARRYFPTPFNVFLMKTGLSRFFPGVRLIDPDDWDAFVSGPCDWVPGCYYLMPRSVVDRLGLFDPRFFLYYEEVDHCRRVRQAGLVVHYYADTTVVHIGGESARSDSSITAAGRQIPALQVESELLYMRKHYGLPGVLGLLALSSLGDAWLAFKSILRGRELAGAALHWRHVATMFSLFWRTACATRPTR